MPEAVEFHQIHVGVRPTRVAVRVGSYEGWEHSALRILEVLSATWGGAGDIIIPGDDAGVTHEQLWTAVELFDPDVWATHVATYRGYQLKDPDGYERFLDAEIDELNRDNDERRGDRRAQLHEFYTREPLSQWEPPASFWERARSRLAPSWDRQYGHAERIRDDELPTGLLVDVTQLSPLPDRIVVAKTDHLPIPARLLIASRFGALAPSARASLEERGVSIQDVSISEDDLARVVGACWGGSRWPGVELQKQLAERLGFAVDDDSGYVALSALQEHGPFAMTMIGLAQFMRPVPVRHDWPLVVVVGDTADDFALAMSFDRCMGPSHWLPPSLLGADTVGILMTALGMPRQRDDRHRTIHVTSCSLDHAALEPIVARMARERGIDKVRISLPVPVPNHRPLTVADTHLASRLEDELFVGGTTGRGIRAQLPSGVEARNPVQLSWWNDVVRFDHQLPPRWPLNEHVVARSGAWRSRARVTREGIAFHSHPLGFISGSLRLDQVVDNPRLRFLDAKDAFEVLSAEAGIELVESPAGRYTARTTELWGGLAALTSDMQRPLVRRILDAFQSKAPSGKAPGNYILERRYLSVSDLQESTRAVEELSEYVDRFLHTGLLRRGLCLACPQCGSFAWYDADDVGQNFRCVRCRTSTVIDSEVVRGAGAEPTWYYALAEVVYQACRANFNVPVLALHQVAGTSHSVLGMTDHEVRFPDDSVEIDLWGIVDGRIVLGEAKSVGVLEASAAKRRKKASRLRRAADSLTADILVLATAASSWSPSSVQAIDDAFAGARCQIDWRVSVDPYLIDGSPGGQASASPAS